jgi:hypothetical protein
VTPRFLRRGIFFKVPRRWRISAAFEAGDNGLRGLLLRHLLLRHVCAGTRFDQGGGRRNDFLTN